MAENRHIVKVTIASPLELTKTDIRFEVRRDGLRFGTLMLSHGAVTWGLLGARSQTCKRSPMRRSPYWARRATLTETLDAAKRWAAESAQIDGSSTPPRFL